MDTSNLYRTENDTLGNIQVPKTAYYGAQTQRAVENFQISGQKLPRVFIKAQGIIKAAAATANMQLGSLAPDKGQAIIQACQEVIEGKWDEHFVVDVFQAGAGTSQNMNANEVIANRAFELLGGITPVHPNDDVNMSQSTNDTFPSALNMAAVETLTTQLLPAILELQQELEKKANEFMNILKAGRTHLHDGVPISLGQEFSGYAATIKSMYQQIQSHVDSLYVIGLGGQAIGTNLKLQPGYIPIVMEEVCKRTNLPFRQPENMFSFMQNMNEPIRCMLSLKELAIHLIKITSDLRLLSSGPRTGLAEITLPSVQPGSSIMPGKVNPAILEMTHMVCCQMIGYETAIATAGIAGQLEINMMMPFIAHTFLDGIKLMTNAIKTLTTKCVSGIQADIQMCNQWMEASLALVTGTSATLGFDKASQIGMQADEEKKTIKQVLKEQNLLTPEIENAIDPTGMV